MSAVHNEQIKLTATYVNGLAIAIFAVGGLAPLIGAFNTADHIPGIGLQFISVICVAVSVALHLWARSYLRRMKP